jgi:acetylornithine aminotransferase
MANMAQHLAAIHWQRLPGFATLMIIEEENLRVHAEQIGDVICNGLRASLKDVAGVNVIRNAGLMIGVELNRSCGDLVKRALAEKLLINVTADNVVRLLPPLVINQGEAEQLVAILSKLIKQFLSE